MCTDITPALMSRDDVLTIRWDRIVTRDDGTVWALCVADTGQPVALALDEEHAEALAGALLDGEDGEEVIHPSDRAAARDAERAALSMRERAVQTAVNWRDVLDGEFRTIEEIRALPLLPDTDTRVADVHATTPEGITPCGLGAWDVPAETDLDTVDCLACLRILAQSAPVRGDDGLAQELDAAQVRVRELEEHFAATPATGKLRARLLATIREVLDQPHHEDYRAGALTTAVMAKVRPLLNERNARVAELEERLAASEARSDRRWLAWHSARRRARRHAGWWRLSEARKGVWVQRALRLEEQRAAVRSVLATWEHRTHHGDSGPMDLLADLQAAVRTRPTDDTAKGSPR